jgi:hypothetical protein
MKKIVLIVVLLSVVSAGSMFAASHTGWSIGAAFYLTWTQSAAPTGAALCVKFPSLPIMFGFSAIFGYYYTTIGVTVDWWAFQTHLVGPVDLYIGPGLFLLIDTSPYGYVDGGLRIPVGFQIFIVPAFEIFLEPALAIHVMPVLPTFGFMASIGLRFWF